MYRFFSAIVVLFTCFRMFSQAEGDFIFNNKDLILNSYSIDDGLASNSIRKIEKLENGSLLIATYNGFSTFDGKVFTNYNNLNTPLLKSNNIYDFCEDDKHQIWLGTQNGLIVFNGISFYLPQELKETLNYNIQCLAFDKNGVLWIGTTNSGLFTYYKNKLNKVAQLNNLDKHIISLLFVDKENRIWIGTEQGNLYKYDGKTFISILNSESGNGYYAACQDIAGNLYFGTRKGLFIYQNNSVNLLTDRLNSINDLVTDKNGILLVACNSGLFYFLKSKNEYYPVFQNIELSSKITQSVYLDDEGILWIGTFRKGLIKCRKGYFENISFEDYGINQVPSDVIELSDDNFMISTDEGEIFEYKNKELDKVQISAFIRGNRVKSLYRDTKKNLWICSYNGLYKITPQSAQFKLLENELSDITIRNIIETDKGDFWIGTRQSGIHKMTSDLKVVKSIDIESNLSSNFVMSLIKGKNGKIFVATKNGFDVLLNDNIIGHYDIKNGLSDKLVFNIYEDTSGILWIATIGGLSMLENGIITNFNEDNGLIENQIYDVVEDNYGYLWLPTNNGIIRARKSELIQFSHQKRKKINSIIFDETDGMQNDQFVSASKLLKRNDGKIVINTLSGLSILDPSVANFSHSEPRLLIKSITTENNTPLIDLKNAELDAYTRYVQIDFSYIDFLSQDKAEFVYKLEPFDSVWQKNANNRFAKYTNLSPGVYKFTVRAIIKSKGEKVIEQSIKFKIKPAFYETAFFKFAFIFILVGLVWIIYVMRVRSIKYQKAALEHLVQERTLEINKQKEAIESHINELEYQKAEIALKNEEIMVAQNIIEQAYLNLKLLSDLGRQITSYLSEDEIIISLYQEINSHMDCDLISIGNYTKPDKVIKYNSSIFKGKKLKPVEGGINDSNCILSQSVLSNSEIVTNNIQNDYPEYSKTFPELSSFKSITSLISIPLTNKNGTIGVFTVQSFRKDSYSEYHFNLIKNLAVYVGIAIENTKTFKQLSIQKDELVKVNASKDRMFSIIGHDLRGPVGTIKSFLDIIIDNPELTDTETIIEILKTMQQSLGSAYTLLDNLLLWARNQRGQVEFEPKVFNIKNSIDEVFNLVMDSAKNKGIKITSKVDYNELVFGDQNMITTVLRNLISNAIKFTSKSGEILVIASKIETTNNLEAEEKVEVKVIDNGVGISETDLEKIFEVNELFTTPGTDKEHGSGLGISICIDFLSRHKQQLIVQNNANLGSPFEHGSTFSFQLQTKTSEENN